MKLITVYELIILLMSRDIKTRYNGNLLNYMMVLYRTIGMDNHYRYFFSIFKSHRANIH